MFVGTAKGKVGNLVLSKFHGEQVTKAYQPTVANPKSYGQMYQRARFANAVKFYKRATQAFFSFAFEDKKITESDFNAFMRHNVSNSLIVNRANYLEPNYPALGNNWRLSDGSLTIPHTITFPSDGGMRLDLGFPVGGSGTTVADISEALVKGGAQNGDIFTLVLIRQQTTTLYNLTEGSSATSVDGAPSWHIMQFVINTNDKTSLTAVATLGSLTAADGFSLVGGDLAPANSVVLFDSSLVPASSYQDIGSQVLAWGAAIISRKTSNGGLLVTQSDLTPNAYAYYVQNLLAAESNIAENVASWQSSDSDVPSAVILKGGVANGLVSGSEVSGTTEQVEGKITNVFGLGSKVDGDYPLILTAVLTPGTRLKYIVQGVNLNLSAFQLIGNGASTLEVSVNNLRTEATVLLTIGDGVTEWELRYDDQASLVEFYPATIKSYTVDGKEVVGGSKVSWAQKSEHTVALTFESWSGGIQAGNVSVSDRAVIGINGKITNNGLVSTIPMVAGSTAGNAYLQYGPTQILEISVS